MNDRSAATGPDSADPGPDRYLAGTQAVVTGAASGIGAAIARKLVTSGAEVLLLDRVADAVEEVAAQLGARSRTVDLADPEAAAELGRGADIVVNNAGMQHVAPVHQFPPDMFSTLLKVMLESPFRIARSALPGMYERGWGRVINVSSVHGLRSSPFKSADVAAKHGLEGLSKTIALETAGHGITSNCICPGYVRTPLLERQVAEQAVLHRVPREQIVEDVLLERTPVKRLVEPEEVAELAAWLCGPAATSVTGSSFPVDGGWTAH
jgi:3-hydroxybutyrate dehydrogenase